MKVVVEEIFKGGFTFHVVNGPFNKAERDILHAIERDRISCQKHVYQDYFCSFHARGTHLGLHNTLHIRGGKPLHHYAKRISWRNTKESVIMNRCRFCS